MHGVITAKAGNHRTSSLPRALCHCARPLAYGRMTDADRWDGKGAEPEVARLLRFHDIRSKRGQLLRTMGWTRSARLRLVWPISSVRSRAQMHTGDMLLWTAAQGFRRRSRHGTSLARHRDMSFLSCLEGALSPQAGLPALG